MKRRSGGRISEDETGATWGDTGSGTMDPVGSVVVGRWGGGEMLGAGELTRGEANDGRRGGDVGGHGLWDDGPRPVRRRRDGGGGISLGAGDADRFFVN